MAKDPYRYFRIEARELLDRLAKGALDLERGADVAEHVAVLLRQAHTLKGAARVVQQREISDLAHAVEDLLATYREQSAPVPQQTIDRLLKTLDGIEAQLARLPGSSDPPGAPEAAAAPQQQAPVESPRSLRTELSEIDAVLDDLQALHGELGGIRRAAATLQPLRQGVARLAAELVAPRPGTTPARLRDQAEALHKALGTFERELAGSAERVACEVRQAHEAIERLRLVPAQTIFHTLQRTARDVAQGSARQVEFTANGGEVRLDGDVLDRVQGALVQLVRNAVAHGIENASDRLAAGKPVTGRVRLEVLRRGQRVAFVCSDDGRGIDVDAVRRVAQQRGVAAAGSDGAAELLRLLLRGGVSTAASVDAYAGRGVGLDVVREAVERLGGEIDLQTEPGRGSHFELLVPVSLVSLQALVVEAGGRLAAVPLDGVRGTLRVAPADVLRTAEGAAVAHDGGLVRLLWLDTLLGAAPARRGLRTVPAFLVDAGPAHGKAVAAAVAVDHFAGIQTVLLRALPELAPADPVVAGVYLDEQGNARPLLDVAAIVQRPVPPDTGATPTPSRPPTVLVVDDSLTTRMLERSILESAGYAVHLATSGEEGLEMASRTDYALVLVDVEMPGMDGFTFVEKAREHPGLRGVPCVLVTSRNAPADRHRGEMAGARAYIVKGEFDQARFLDHVASLVAQATAE